MSFKNNKCKKIFSVMMLGFLVTTISSCKEEILSFEDLKTSGFSSFKGVGLGLKPARNSSKKKNANGDNGVDLLTLDSNEKIEEVQFENNEGNEASLGLNLSRYSVYEKYAVMAYSKTKFDSVIPYTDPIFRDGHEYKFIYSFISGKLYYLNLENMIEVDCFNSGENILTARAKFLEGNNDYYTFLCMTETKDGLVVENLKSLFDLQELNSFSEAVASTKIGKDKNILIGSNIFRKNDGTFSKTNHECGRLVDGGFAGMKKESNGSVTFVKFNEKLETSAVSSSEDLIFNYSWYIENAVKDNHITCRFGDTLYEDSDLTIYQVKDNNELVCLKDNNGEIVKETLSSSAQLSKNYLYGDKLVYLDSISNKIYSYNVKTNVTELIFDVSTEPNINNLIYFQYGANGNFYMKYFDSSSIEKTAIIIDGEFKEEEFSDSYFSFDIRPTFIEELDKIINERVPHERNNQFKILKAFR